MSTSPLPPPQARPVEPAQPGRFRSFLTYVFFPHAKPGEIIIISHSNLFYWWPVWATAFIMAALTWFNNHYLAVVPPGTRAAENRLVEIPTESGESKMERRDVLILDKEHHLPTRVRADGTTTIMQPRYRMSTNKNVGILFTIILLLVIFITNVPLRGLWSVFVIVFIIMLAIIFAAFGIWDRIVARVGLLAIHINLGGYLLIGLVLFAIWLINFLFFDRQFYMIFTPGQVRVHLEIGAGETVYGTDGMVFQKQRSDLFRHWILGFGSGDLIIRPGGGSQHIDLPNVLHVGRKVREVEKRLAEREVVTG